jgi:hypothetical protein
MGAGAPHTLLRLKDLGLTRWFLPCTYLRLGALGLYGATENRGDRDFDPMVEHRATKTSLKPIEQFAPSD